LNRNHIHHFHNKNHHKHHNHHNSNKNSGHIKVFNSESNEYEDSFDDYTDRFNGRTLDVNSNNSRYQYQTNKSNRIADGAESTGKKNTIFKREVGLILKTRELNLETHEIYKYAKLP